MSSNEQRRQAAKSKLERQLARREEQARKRRTVAVTTTIVVVIAAVVGVYFLTRTAEGGDNAASAPPSSTTTSEQSNSEQISIPTELAPAPSRPEPLPNQVSCTYRSKGEPAKPVEPPEDGEVSSQGTVQATIEANVGTIPITLDRSLAPCTVNSFVHLAESGFYNDTPCHRISTSGLQMLQCGDPTGKGTGGPGYQFDDETYSDIQYGRGYLAMANSGADTNGSQFFIVYGEAPLQSNYTVFGTVSKEGLQVVDEVARAGHDGAFSSAGGGHPNKKVTFEKVTVKS
ncbi:peptidyl-prolyl cis-trans isomerase B (cyclophilin B) [Actinopolyspora alba]|uniref:Peptidyl-prolyl cis-trans isomerase n=1 Tax=Actinopolyspora alba TaxID=673379 RepID=A0A1I1XKQ1_9ACTN|nr:peptidylprolyl isomerase [Actinopolyspora alba]SFE07882.1 peptidyl-prolyl cis-trans isomerase B (cyclophilin B) [Actinopolyspora alba]